VTKRHPHPHPPTSCRLLADLHFLGLCRGCARPVTHSATSGQDKSCRCSTSPQKRGYVDSGYYIYHLL
jgi:hypothetical protein